MAELGTVTRTLLGMVRDGTGDRELAGRICRACVDGLDVDGAAMSLLTGSVARETLWATDRTAELLEDLQFTFNEGACMEAAATGNPVFVADLHHATETARWPIFAAAVAEQTLAAALFALPLQWGAVNLGVIDLYRATPGGLTDAQRRDALAAVDTAVLMLLGQRTDPGDGSGGWLDQAMGTGPRSTRPPAWSWPSSTSARPTHWPGYAPTRSSPAGYSSMSRAMWSTAAWCSPRT